MRVVPLRLHRRPHALRPATAWLVPGHSPAEWLAEIARWPAKQAALRCLVLPLAQQQADAVLVLLTEPLPETFRPERCQPYGAITPHLLAPVEGLVEPTLTTEEWPTLLPGEETIYVWRAAGDLVGFEPGDVLTISELLTANIEPTQRWTEARDVPGYVSRLRSITSSMPIPSLEDVAATWRNDIGPNSAPSQIQPSPDEPPLHWTERLANSTAGLRRGWRHSATAISQFYQRFRGLVRAIALVVIVLIASVAIRNLGNPSFGSWPEFLVVMAITALALALLRWSQNYGGTGQTQEPAASYSGNNGAFSEGISLFWTWFSRGLQSITPRGMTFSPFEEANRRQREREIRRLLHMLDQNPEEGLRYAIPFGGEAGRGLASPGNQLVARDPVFRLGAGGSVAADYWDISAEHQLRLTASYRSLAEREQRAGRHRRAAYICSQLLNDWRSAATALVAGHHYADAAVIYEKRLQNVAEAARYYELAGQFDKALQLYIDGGHWIAAGDLCTRAERLDDAHLYYRSAVNAALSARNVPHAAELLEQKLDAVDEALVLLEEAWANDSRADACLDAWFDLTARHHRTDTALTRIETLSQNTTPTTALRLLPRWLRVHQRYPNAAVQQQAAEFTLRVVAEHLRNASPSVAQELTSFLPALVPNDRLLSRDCQRYVETSRSLAPKKPAPLPQPKVELRLTHQFTLPENRIAVPAVTTVHGWVVLMEPTFTKPQELILTSWEAIAGVVPLQVRTVPPRLLAVDASDRHIWLKSSAPPTRVAWRSDLENWQIVSPEFLPNHTVVAIPGSSVTRALWFDEFFAAWLSFFTANGESVRSFRIAEEWLGDPKQVVPLLHGKAALQSLGDNETMTFLPVGDGQIFGEHFSSEGIRQWAGMLPGNEIVCHHNNIHSASNSRTVLLLQNEAVVVVDDVCRAEASQRVLPGWHNAKATFLLGDLFVVVDDRRIALFRLSENVAIAMSAHTASSPLAISPCGVAKCSVLRSDGTIETWSW